MRWLYKLPLRLRSLFHKAEVDEELTEELRFHLQALIEANRAKGMSPEESRYAGLRELGGFEQIREECRDMRRVNYAEHLLQDVRYGVRMLARNPGFTAVAVLTLALGIGANTAIFTLVDAVLLQTLPVRNPQQLVLLNWASQVWPEDVVNSMAGAWYKDKSGRVTGTSFPYPTYAELQARNHVFSSLTALAGNGSQWDVGYNGQPERADGQLVSGTFFSTLGVHAIRGRVFDTGDDRAGATQAAVISYGYWERRFGRDPGIVGRTIAVNGVPFSIVGVAPAEFYGVQPGRFVEVWLPLHAQEQVEPQCSPAPPETGKESAVRPLSPFDARDSWWVVVIGRLRPGVSQQRARAALEVVFQQSIASDLKATTKAQTVPHLGVESGSKGLEYLRRDFAKPLFILMTLVGLVLLIACANVANLLLARGQSRQKEISMRLALGAGRGRLIRQLLTESVFLSGLSGATGLVLAFLGARVLVTFMSSGREPINLSLTPDLRVLAFTAAVSVLTGILFGLSPALRSTRVDLTAALKQSADGSASPLPGKGGFRLGLGRGLVVIQVSLSLILLLGAGLFVRTLTNLESVNPGFNVHNLLLFGIDPTHDGYKGPRLIALYQELARRIERLPGVESVSLSQSTLIGGGGNFQRIHIEGYTPKSGEQTGAAINWIGPKFFQTLGIPVLLGRTITARDTEAKPKAVVVNGKFVREFLGTGDPIGRRFSLGESEDAEIVGVVGNAKYFNLRQETPATIYAPWTPDNGAMNFEVRTAGNPMELTGAVRHVAQDVDRKVALYDVRSEVEQINQSLFQERLFAQFTSFFGILAALLACVGIYGIMAFAVTRRTREIGIRMALGASRGGIAEMVLRESLVLVGIGIAIGVLVALGVSRLISSLLYGVTPHDPLMIAIAASVMLVTAALAAYLPARRATKVDPMLALRYE